MVKNIYQRILDWNVTNPLNIVIGEGEFIIPHLVLEDYAENPVQRIGKKSVYRVTKDSIYFPNNISEVQLDRKYFGDEIVMNHYGEQEMAIITSRGCPYNCAFCGGAHGMNTDVTIRTRSEESVIAEIADALSAHPDVKSIRILDDLFLRNTKSIEVANRIFSNFPQLSWRGMAHVMTCLNAEEKLCELRMGHCRELFIGIESGSDGMRKKINKIGSVDDVIYVSRRILEEGIDLKGYFIYGFPHENVEDFQKTYELAQKIYEISLTTQGTFRTSVFQFRPYDGTQLYNEILAENGSINPMAFNDSISGTFGRSQFNFSSGNYSAEPDDVLNYFILKTQSLTGKEND